MNIKIRLTNRYDYELLIYPFNDGCHPEADKATRVARKEGSGELSLANGECGVIAIPGMGDLLVQFMGQQRLENIHDRHCETPSDFDKFEQMALLRYKTTELYWRFPSTDDDAELQLSINELGTVCLDKVLSGEARQVSLPEFFIPPVFCPHGPEGEVEAT